MPSYQYLKTTNLSLESVWEWAKKLVQDLNKFDQAVPAGVIAPFAGSVAPIGWLLCDGGLYSRYEYPVLFASIAYDWGGADDFFNVPDFRDRYLIGAGDLLDATAIGGGDTESYAAGAGDTLYKGLPPSVGIHFIIKA